MRVPVRDNGIGFETNQVDLDFVLRNLNINKVSTIRTFQLIAIDGQMLVALTEPVLVEELGLTPLQARKVVQRLH